MKIRNIAIVFGGFSGERAISIKSAELVLRHLDPNRFYGILVDIDKHEWHAAVGDHKYPIDKTDFSFSTSQEKIVFDGVFNAIHGTPGEDGKLQGYFDMLSIPYNSCDVLASSLTFDKYICNRYLEAAGISIAKAKLIRKGESFNPAEITEELGLPCFVKPNDGGSSLGITKVSAAADLTEAVSKAQIDGVPALVESFLDGIEVSCGCISEAGEIKSVAVTEIVPANEYFDYESKYLSDSTQEITPARISPTDYDKVMSLTEQIYHLVNAKGMIRVDYMVCEDGIFCIEVNTTPGLSEASIIPKQLKYAGYSLQKFFQRSLEEMFV